MYDALYEIFEQVVIPVMVAIGGGITGWLFGRRKRAAEAKSAEIGNLDRILEMWQETTEYYKKLSQEFMTQNTEHMVKQNTEVIALRNDNIQLHRDIDKLKAVIRKLELENKALVERIKELEKNYDEALNRLEGTT